MVWNASAVRKSLGRGRARVAGVVFLERARLGPGLGGEASLPRLEKRPQCRCGGWTSLGPAERAGEIEGVGAGAMDLGMVSMGDAYPGQSSD